MGQQLHPQAQSQPGELSPSLDGTTAQSDSISSVEPTGPSDSIQAIATSPSATHRYAADQAQMAQARVAFSEAVHSHTSRLSVLADQSLQSWLNYRHTAEVTQQNALAALEVATSMEAETAQLNRSIQKQLQQFDWQLRVSSATLEQEVSQKVSQVHRHIQQQSNHYRRRLNLNNIQQHRDGNSQQFQARQLFQQLLISTAG